MIAGRVGDVNAEGGLLEVRRADTGHFIPLNTANWCGNAGFGSRVPRWYTDKSGIIHLQGAVTQTSGSGAGAGLIGTLPSAAMPSLRYS